MRKRSERAWVLDNVSLVEDEPGKSWTLYVGHWTRDVEVGEVVLGTTRVEFRDKAGRLRATYASFADFEQHNELGTFVATAPNWLVFGWKSRAARLRSWRRSRGGRERAARRIRQKFDAAFKGPRWNDYPIDYAKLSDDRIRDGKLSAVKRMRRKLGLPRELSEEQSDALWAKARGMT